MVNAMKPQEGKKLTPKERLFVAEYLKDLNATQAAIRAGYSRKTAKQTGHENLTKPYIQKALSESRNSIERREERALLTAYEVEKLLDEMIRADPKDYFDERGRLKAIHELTDEQARGVKELEISKTQSRSYWTIKFFDKVAAIEKKMRRLGMFKDVMQVEDPYIVFLRRIKEVAARKSGGAGS